MAIIDTSRPAPFGAVSTYRIVNTIDNVAANIISGYRAKKNEKALQSLSNAQLEDIGITRAQIQDVAKRVSNM